MSDRRLRERVGEKVGQKIEKGRERIERVGDRLEGIGVRPPPRPQYPPRAYVADMLTLANGIFGFFAILVMSVELGYFERFPDRYVAFAWIGLGAIADGLDGIVARRWGSTGLGESLDTISDSITFALAPAVLLLEIQGEQTPILASVAATALLLAGMLRLARNRERGSRESRTFDGLPAPWSGTTVAVVVLMQVESGLPPWIPPVVALALAVLNVSHVKYPKTRGPALTAMALVLLAIAMAVVVALIAAPSFARTILSFAAVLAACLIVLTPWMTPRLDAR